MDDNNNSVAKNSRSGGSADANGFWTAKDVELATGGEWLQAPPQDWRATGLSIYAPAMQPANMAVVRTEKDTCGMPEAAVHTMLQQPACLITTAPEELTNPQVPVLKISDGTEAVLSLGRYARNQMAGKVIGVTGSAGKTTCVAMLAGALSAWGTVCKSAFNANLPRGVAWNLASVPWDAPFAVLEMAIGRMGISARMARPHIAVFTNIQPAHLGEKDTLRDIAVTKSAIFSGMTPGSIAVLNRDMLEWETVREAAEKRQLTILTYGESSGCDFQLLKYEADTHRVTVNAQGQTLSYVPGAGGKHMAINSLAVLATVAALGLPLAPATEKLALFQALAGRGEESSILLNGQRITVLDDAYNANPGSMAAALERLSETQPAGRRIAVLGEMAELGRDTQRYHTEMAALINRSQIDRVYLAGEAYAECWQQIDNARKGEFVASPLALKPLLLNTLQEGDIVLFKGSHSTRIHELVRWMSALNK
ncbi:UDP-N-acetylmuramoyl-tripeptide--D-alanyl-D-alanine ligase [Atlantibacter hermannii]|uniref:UDP-N-acetylmuramoyl-tripeptide--D-alanyl-D- alanine ligase n=1 Tax=Atlantibacter hermannii TaxID=565 RepID=UPI00289749DA|nr:UDP-N-acetylmuramoyl-tripeptide--D-alanyl-D-alanine ligase [Atlantibacter hermannii]